MKLGDLFPGLDLNRPEYPSNPELLPAALGHSLVGSSKQQTDEGKVRGRVYKRLAESRSKKMSVEETVPTDESLAKALMAVGVSPQGEADFSVAAASLSSSMEGTRPAKAKGVAACPISAAMLFLQDSRGLQNKTNPPNFAAIIEAIWASGSHAPTPDRPAAKSFYRALANGDSSPTLNAFDEAFRASARGDEIVLPALEQLAGTGGAGNIETCWLANQRTPQRWFAQAWDSFCEPEWRRALPARRWADWASCILRTGVALAYLYEARFYQRLGRFLVDDSLDAHGAWEAIVTAPSELLQWMPGTQMLTMADQNRRMRGIVAAGVGVRTEVQAACSAVDGGNPFSSGGQLDRDKLAAVIVWLRKSLGKRGRQAIQDCYGVAPKGAAKNTMETIAYLLQVRQKAGRDADFYGLLERRSRRFLVFDPSEEWIVVFASMVAREPAGEAILRDVREQLSWLGIEADRDTIVGELERAGLSRSSHDADDAIIVRAGF